MAKTPTPAEYEQAKESQRSNFKSHRTKPSKSDLDVVETIRTYEAMLDEQERADS